MKVKAALIVTIMVTALMLTGCMAWSQYQAYGNMFWTLQFCGRTIFVYNEMTGWGRVWNPYDETVWVQVTYGGMITTTRIKPRDREAVQNLLPGAKVGVYTQTQEPICNMVIE